MNIQILQLTEGAKQAKGCVVIIDVFRAFSLAPYAFSIGAERIYPVGTVEEAFSLREHIPNALIAGERNEQKVPGFDFGNSPTEILKSDLKGKTLIHTTSAGTQGLVNATNASVLLTGSFVNAKANVRFIRNLNPSDVSLVCMGYSTLYPTEEDTFCAEYMKAFLLGEETDFEEMVRIIRDTSGRRFFEPEKQHFAPSSDFELCLQPNRFDFVLKAEKKDGLLELNRFNC